MDGNTVETIEATVVAGTPPSAPAQTPAPEGFSGKPGDFQKDMALLAGQTQTQVQEPQTEPEQPEATATAPATPVPEKFKNPDGTPNVEKISKSTADAEIALQKYLAIEKDLRKTQNTVAQLKSPGTQPQNQTQQQGEPASFAQVIEQDVQKNGLGTVLANLFEAAKAAAKEDALKDVADIRQETELSKRQRELESIAKSDPWVLSPEGFDQLSKIRQARPWINGSQTPWTEAYRQHLADQMLAQRQGTVQTPTPKGQTATPPATPVSPSPRVSVQPTGPKLDQMSAEQITNHVKGLTPKQEAEFWKSRGLKFPK